MITQDCDFELSQRDTLVISENEALTQSAESTYGYRRRGYRAIGGGLTNASSKSCRLRVAETNFQQLTVVDEVQTFRELFVRPLAIIPVYNEADILPSVLTHLEQQGCDVYVLDNWSTDLSPELRERIGGNVERWPVERPTMYEWTAILSRIEEIALHRGKGRWVIFHDADEIRRVPGDWSSLTLAGALQIATITGYNAVGFRVRTFVPTDNLWKAGGNPERHFRYYRDEHVDHSLPHIKAWFQGEQRVDLHTNGGHQAVFADRHVCPHPFLLKHYPIRSQEHGARKVLKERFPRYPEKERSKKWHVQYDEYVEAPTPNFLGNPAELRKDKNNTTIVAIASSVERFTTLAESVEKYERTCDRIVVSSSAFKIDRPGWRTVQGSANAGIAAAGDDDVLLLRDDTELVGPIAEELSEVAYLTSAAIVGAQVVCGDAPAHPIYKMDSRWKQVRHAIPLACVLLRRAALDRFDPTEESEVEFSRRAAALGFPLVMCRCRVAQSVVESREAEAICA